MLACTLFSAILLALSAAAAPASTENGLVVRASSPGSVWAGSVYHYPAGQIKAVKGTFVVPKPTAPAGGGLNTVYATSIVVGIDGAKCTSAFLQAGVALTVFGGSATYVPFYQWSPARPVTLSAPTIKNGQSVMVTVTATSKTTGTVTIKNNTTGQVSTQTVSSSTPLCQQDVEWLVEASTGVNNLPNFATVQYTSTTATLSSGATIGSGNGDNAFIVNSAGKTVVSTSLANGAVTLTYSA